MGRIKTKLVKRKTFDIMEAHGDKFTTDYEQNKERVEQYADIPSRKMRNLIAGYVTRLVKSKKS
jgi:small subunit ribosomal protein S17e